MTCAFVSLVNRGSLIIVALLGGTAAANADGGPWANVAALAIETDPPASQVELGTQLTARLVARDKAGRPLEWTRSATIEWNASANLKDDEPGSCEFPPWCGASAAGSHRFVTLTAGPAEIRARFQGLEATRVIEIVSAANVAMAELPPQTAAIPVGELSGVTQLALGWEHGCALLADTTVRCWGRNQTGQLGVGTRSNDTGNQTVPVLALGAGVVEVSCGADHTCARKSDGSIWCWGANWEGQLGRGGPDMRAASGAALDAMFAEGTIPRRVPNLGDAVQVATAGARSCAVFHDGAIQCWGSGQAEPRTGFGRLVEWFSRTPMSSRGPVVAADFHDATALALGSDAANDDFACARVRSGLLRCWGNNRDGQLGDGTTQGRRAPVSVATGPVRAVAAGFLETCALSESGAALCWGSDHSPAPTPLEGSARIRALALDPFGNRRCVVTVDDEARCWGFSPDDLPPLAHVAQLALGGRQVCALYRDGRARCGRDRR